MSAADGAIQVVWQCGMPAEDCINKDRPGTHTEYADAQDCVHQGEPRDLKRLHLR
jgi:hypothetical protein